MTEKSYLSSPITEGKGEDEVDVEVEVDQTIPFLATFDQSNSLFLSQIFLALIPAASARVCFDDNRHK
jgi:hypothetical protein